NDIIRFAHNEAQGAYNGISLLKLMGRDSGFIAANAALSIQEVNFVLIPEIKFDLNGPYGFLKALRKRLESRHHALIVVAEGAGQYFFEGEKIIVLRKCSKEPIFTYTDFDCYVSQTFFIIQSNRINLKYLTGLLNSKLIAFWLRKKGKLQGNAYQLDKEPLLEIPIYKPNESEANKIAVLVDKIIAQKQQGKDSSENEKKIDELVYKLYDITPEEQKTIEQNT
ncbi:MAG: hypothetical protein HGB12_07770, partial [Bacteroidetes bacterium]|nr:hypothetical protein [Bacteroidota bacterium]